MKECKGFPGRDVESDGRSDGSYGGEGKPTRGILRLPEWCRGQIDDQKCNEGVLEGEKEVLSVGRKGKVVSIRIRRCDGVCECFKNVCG